MKHLYQMRSIFEALEPRILLSATALPESQQESAVLSSFHQSAQTETLVEEILFIDSSVEDYSSILDNLQRNIEIVLIQSDENGIDKISSYLNDRTALNSLHIISHGGDGFLQLGNTQLNDNNVQLTSSWGNSLNENGGIFLYGCNVAQSDAGKTFVDNLGNLNRVSVAASTDITGSHKEGGDWDLEYSHSDDLSSTLAFTDYEGLLIANDLTDFVITVTTASDGESFTFYTEDTDYNIDWNNDGTADAVNVSGNQSHVFANAGVHVIRFSELTDIFINNQADKAKYTSIEQWGNGLWDADMSNAFYGASNLISNAADVADMSNVTDMFGMFRGAAKYNEDISSWDVSNVTIMTRMFTGAKAFDQDIGGWDVSNVTNMNAMFSNAISFDQDIGGWDVSEVSSMNSIFANASSFNQDIGGWNVSKLKNMGGVFSEASSFNQDISGWDVSNVTEFKRTFNRASSFNQDLSLWQVSNSSSFYEIFKDTDMSVENYDKILNSSTGWTSQPVKSGINFGAPDYYTDTSGRNELISKGWTITGDALLTRVIHSATPTNVIVSGSPVTFAGSDYTITDGTSNSTKQVIYEIANVANNADEKLNFNGLTISLTNGISVSDTKGSAAVSVNDSTATVIYSYNVQILNTLAEEDIKGATYEFSSINSQKTVNITLNDEYGALSSALYLGSVAPNSPPTLNSFAAAVKTTNEDSQIEIMLSDLLAQGDEQDIDGSVDAFIVQNISSGTLKIGSNAGSATIFIPGSNDTIDAENNAYWTPLSNVSGEAISAFAVLAQDDLGARSSTPVQLHINVNPVNDAPSLSSFAASVAIGYKNSPIEITLSDLLAQGDEQDIDGSVDAFIVQNISSGTLKIGSNAGSATIFIPGSNDTIDAENNAYWTPLSNVSGEAISAFTVLAQDDLGARSDSATSVKIDILNSPETDFFPSRSAIFVDTAQSLQTQSLPAKMHSANSVLLLKLPNSLISSFEENSSLSIDRKNISLDQLYIKDILNNSKYNLLNQDDLNKDDESKERLKNDEIDEEEDDNLFKIEDEIPEQSESISNQELTQKDLDERFCIEDVLFKEFDVFDTQRAR